MKKSLVVLACVLSLLATGCASSPKKIRAAYVSPLKFKDYDCDQIALEMDYVGQRANELFHSLRRTASNDKMQMVGGFLLWPIWFTLEGGDGPEASEYAQLKGEYEALRQAAIEKKCSLEELPPSPDELFEAEKKKQKEEAEAAPRRGSSATN